MVCDTRDCRANPGRHVCRAFGSLALMLCLAGPLAAQVNYEELPLHPKAPRWTNLSISDEGRAIDTVMRSNDAFDAAALDSFFNEMLFPLFTQWKDVRGVSPFVVGPGSYPPSVMRARFKNAYLTGQKNAKAREHVIELTFKMMQRIAAGNFHPVVRANATMLLADLGEGDPNASPPLKKVAPVLLKLATAADTPDAVRAPALRGLLRHAQTQPGIAAEQRPQVTTAMLELLAQSQLPAGRSAQGHDWMRRRAIDVLAAMNAGGPNPPVVKALLQTIGDASSSVAVRAAAASAVGKMKLASLPDTTPDAVAQSLRKLAVDAYHTELAERELRQSPIIAERLRDYLASVRTALVGPDGKAGLLSVSPAAPDQQRIQALVAQLDKLAAACNTAEAPGTTARGVSGEIIVVDKQKPVADAIAAAGRELEGSGEGGSPPAAAPPQAPAAAGPVGPGPAATSRSPTG